MGIGYVLRRGERAAPPWGINKAGTEAINALKLTKRRKACPLGLAAPATGAPRMFSRAGSTTRTGENTMHEGDEGRAFGVEVVLSFLGTGMGKRDDSPSLFAFYWAERPATLRPGKTAKCRASNTLRREAGPIQYIHTPTDSS
jgi:hypothetical protein